MAMSVLMAYQPVDTTRELEGYWRSYIEFYEKYWDGPATPQSSWYGREYDEFRTALSKQLGIGKKDVKHCFFMKDEEGESYVTPIFEGVNLNVYSAENFIPLEWFLMYERDEKNYFYTHTGFGAIEHDAIYYITKIASAVKRLQEARAQIETALGKMTENEQAQFGRVLSALIEGIDNLWSWVGGFDERGFINLNYGEISTLIEPATMKNEDSVSELRNVLALCTSGKYTEAASSFAILMQKWDEIRAIAEGSAEKSTVQ